MDADRVDALRRQQILHGGPHLASVAVYERHTHVLVSAHGLARDLKGALVAVERDDPSAIAARGGFLNDDLGDQPGAGGHVQVHKWVGHAVKQPGNQVSVDLAVFGDGRKVAEVKISHARGASVVC